MQPATSQNLHVSLVALLLSPVNPVQYVGKLLAAAIDSCNCNVIVHVIIIVY